MGFVMAFPTKHFFMLIFMTLMGVIHSAYAAQFKLGETVFVAYPAGNIKDDAFIIGKVTSINEQGDYLLSVLDYVEGHDYGLSCVPMMKKQTPNSEQSMYGTGWDLWKDTTVLEKERLDYLVSRQDVMKLGKGKHLFIERNNLYIVFGRWKSDAPMLTIDRIERAEKEAKESHIEGLLPALQLVKLHRQSFYGEYNRPYRSFETIAPLNTLLDSVLTLFEQNAALKAIWVSRQRDWQGLSKSTRDYFLIEAIDKVVDDAKSQLTEDDVEKAGSQALTELKNKLKQLQRNR